MVTAIIVVIAVVPLVPTMIIPVSVPVVVPVIAMLSPVTRNVFAVVPVVPHKVDPISAGVVFAAMPAPMFGMAWRYTQVDWRAGYRYLLDDYRLTIDHSWLRIAADIESAIEAWLADADRDPNIGSECRRGHGGSGYCRCD